jgi:ABC-2 type transport system permease protein
MPPFFRYLTYLDPLRYFMEMMRGIFLKGSGPAELWFNMVALGLLGTVLFILSIRRFSRGFE